MNKGTAKSNGTPLPFVEMCQKSLATGVGMHKDFLGALEEFNHDWSERAAAEERVAFFLGRKHRSALSRTTRADGIETALARLRDNVSKLGAIAPS